MWPLREKLLGSTRIHRAMAGEGGGSSAAAVNGADPQQQQQTQTPDPEKQQLEDIHNIWESPAQDPDKDKGSQATEKKELSSEQINAALDQHVKNMDLMGGVDTDSIMKGLAESDPSALIGALQSTAENVAKRLIPTMAQLMDKKIQGIKNELVAEARGATQSDLAFQKMEAELPFTKEKHVNPVARAVMKQAMQNHGKSAEEAVKFVQGFFKEIYAKGSKDLGIQTPPRNRPGQSRSQQQAAMSDISEESEVDFVSLFKNGQ